MKINDLLQDLFATDQDSRRFAHLYDPLHPAVLGIIYDLAATARHHGRPLSVCGETDSRVQCATGLLTVGVRELSVSSGMLLRVRRLIQLVDARALGGLHEDLCAVKGGSAVRDKLKEELQW